MSELPWNWAYYPYLDPPEKQKESALEAGYIKVVNKDDADKVIAELRHQKYKRCLAKKTECKFRSIRYRDLWEKYRKNEYDTSGSYYKDYIKWWHRAMKWSSIAEKFKERKNAED